METVIFSDVVTRCNTKEDRHNTGKLYYVGGEHIESNEMKVKNKGLIQGSTIGPMFYCGFKPGDILFVTRNPHLRKCGMVDFDGICSEKTFVLKTKDSTRLLQEYLAIVMQSDDFWNYCEENKSGGVNYFVNWSTLANYEFSLPPLSEQKALAEKLWAAYEVKQSYLKMIAATEEMVKSQFVEMFDFKDLEVSNPSNDFEELCFDDTSSATKIPASEYKQFGKYPIFDQSQDCIIAGYSDSKDGVCEHYPAVLFGDHSRVIKFIDEPFFIGADGVKIIKPKSENIITKFLFYDLKYHTIPNTGYNRHFKYIKMLKLTKASIEDQQKFLAIAEQADKSAFELKKSIAAIDGVIKSLVNEKVETK